MECLHSIAPLVHQKQCRVKSEECRVVSVPNSALLTLHFLRRAVEFGLSVKSERMSGFEPRASRNMAGFPAPSLSVVAFPWVWSRAVTTNRVTSQLALPQAVMVGVRQSPT